MTRTCKDCHVELDAKQADCGDETKYGHEQRCCACFDARARSEWLDVRDTHQIAPAKAAKGGAA